MFFCCSGVDVVALLTRVGLGTMFANVASGAGIFAIAYALYKPTIFLRVPLTFYCVPKIVNSLRRAGWLKKPKP